VTAEKIVFHDKVSGEPVGFLDYESFPLKLAYLDRLGVSDGSLTPEALKRMYKTQLGYLKERPSGVFAGLDAKTSAFLNVALLLRKVTYANGVTVEFRGKKY